MMKEMSFYTLFSALKLKEDRELQHYAKKEMEARFGKENAVMLTRYIRKDKNSEQDYKAATAAGTLSLSEEALDDLKKTMEEKKNALPTECMMEMYNSDKDFLVQTAKKYAVANYGQYVYECIHKYYSTYSSHMEEFYQCGVIGILKALKNYDLQQNAFITYAKPYIKHELSGLVNFYNNGITVHFNTIQQQIRKATAQLKDQGLEPTARRIAIITDLKPEIIQRELNYQNCTKFQYLDDPDASVDIACPYGSTPEAIAEVNEKNRSLYLGLKNLDEKTRNIIILRSEGETNENIAKAVGLTVGQIKAMYQKGITRLRKDDNLKRVYTEMLGDAEIEMLRYSTPISENAKDAKEQCKKALNIMGSFSSPSLFSCETAQYDIAL